MLEEPIPHDPTCEPHDLAAVLPMTAEVCDGHLHVGGVDMVELARTQGTALYVMDEAHLRHNMREYMKWTRYHWDDVDVMYAMKAFTSVAMVQMLEQEGLGVLTASGGELAMALAGGMPPERILMHGNNKTYTELEEAVDAKVGRIIGDSLEELDRISEIATARGVEQPVLIRVTPGIKPDTHGYIQTGQNDSKFGFGLNHGLALAGVKRAIELPGITLKGLHMHIGSQIFALQSYAKAIEVVVAFMEEIRQETGYTVEELDTGGGLGIAYGLPDEPSSVEQYGKVIVDGIKDEVERHGLPVPKMMVEPGRSMVANAGISLYTVGTIKEVPEIRTYVAVDGGMTDNIRPALYDAEYECLIANKADDDRTEVVTVAGKHCETGDLLIKDAQIQPVDLDDILCICSTGAYCRTMASNYNSQVRPAVVLVGDGEARVIVKRETYEDLLRNEVALES